MIDFENEESIGINDGNNVKKYKIIYADPPWDYGNSKNMNSHFWGNG